MIIVRLLLALALIAIGISLALYFVRRDRRYLVFVWQVAKFTLLALLAVLLWFAGERLMAPAPGHPSPPSATAPARL
jgi:hypothetical protein